MREPRYEQYTQEVKDFLNNKNHIIKNLTDENRQEFESINNIFKSAEPKSSKNKSKKKSELSNSTPEYIINFFNAFYESSENRQKLKDLHLAMTYESKRASNEFNQSRYESRDFLNKTTKSPRFISQEELKPISSKCIGFMKCRNNNQELCIVSLSGIYHSDETNIVSLEDPVGTTAKTVADAIMKTVNNLNQSSKIRYIFHSNPSDRHVKLYSDIAAFKNDNNIIPEKTCAEVSQVDWLLKTKSLKSHKNITVIEQFYYLLPKTHHLNEYKKDTNIVSSKKRKFSNIETSSLPSCMPCQNKFELYRDFISVAYLLGIRHDDNDFKILTTLKKETDDIDPNSEANITANHYKTKVGKKLGFNLGMNRHQLLDGNIMKDNKTPKEKLIRNDIEDSDPVNHFNYKSEGSDFKKLLYYNKENNLQYNNIYSLLIKDKGVFSKQRDLKQSSSETEIFSSLEYNK